MPLPEPPKAVAAAFNAFPVRARSGALALRTLILETATRLPHVGPVEECLKWGQPAYTTPLSLIHI